MCEFKVFYGTTDNKIDVTNTCLEKLQQNGVITIPEHDFVRSDIFTDPIYGTLKKIFILKDEELKEYDYRRSIIIDTNSGKITTTFSNEIVGKLSEIHPKLKIKYGSFESEYTEQTLSVRYLTGNEKILEIGGNIGRNSLIIAYILSQQNNNNFLVLESDEIFANQLQENRDINNFNFNIESSALSKRKLIQKGWQTIESDVLLDGYKNVNIISYEELQNKYNIEFDTLILDCEGAFYYILKDMPEILNNIKLIIVENDYFDVSKQNYVDEILKQNNFYLDYFETGPPGLLPQYIENFYNVWKRDLKQNN